MFLVIWRTTRFGYWSTHTTSTFVRPAASPSSRRARRVALSGWGAGRRSRHHPSRRLQHHRVMPSHGEGRHVAGRCRVACCSHRHRALCFTGGIAGGAPWPADAEKPAACTTTATLCRGEADGAPSVMHVSVPASCSSWPRCLCEFLHPIPCRCPILSFVHLFQFNLHIVLHLCFSNYLLCMPTSCLMKIEAGYKWKWIPLWALLSTY
jgi:hypothetical protein